MPCFSPITRVVAVIIACLVAIASGQVPSDDEDLRRRIQMITNRYPPGWPFLGHCIEPFGPGGILNFELRQCEEQESPPFNKESRIAIVGAGPAGISMVKLLHDRGFTDLTLFEKEGRVGGKSKSIELDDGERFDLGTIWTGGKYECVELLAEHVNMTEKPVNPDGQTPRLVSSDEARLLNMAPPEFGEFNQWSADYANRKYDVSLAEYGDILSQNAQAYIGLWAETMGSNEYMFPDESTVDFESLDQSFLSWLEDHNLYAFIPSLILSTSAQGYGNLETIPAFYGLMWNHPNLFGGTGTQAGMFEDWQTMWERILSNTDATVKLETEILKIERKKNKVEIEYIGRNNIFDRTKKSKRSKGKKGSRHRRSESFDFLIMAAPMPLALNMLEKPTSEELELFSKYNYKSVRYDVGYLESTGDVPKESFNLFSWMDRHNKQTDYHVAHRNPGSKKNSGSNKDTTIERNVLVRDGIDGALTLARLGRIKGEESDGDEYSSASVIFSISPFGTTKEEVRSLLAQDLSEYNMEMSFFHTEIWPDYFPWKNLTQVVEERVPWRIWENQGAELTWYVGSYASFESVADVLDYNIKMVNEKLCV